MKKKILTAVEITPFAVKIVAAVLSGPDCRIVTADVYLPGESTGGPEDLPEGFLKGEPYGELRVIIPRQRSVIQKTGEPSSRENGSFAPFEREDAVPFVMPGWSTGGQEDVYRGIVPGTFLEEYQRYQPERRFASCRAMLSSAALAALTARLRGSGAAGDMVLVMDIDDEGCETCFVRDGVCLYSCYFPEGRRVFRETGVRRWAEDVFSVLNRHQRLENVARIIFLGAPGSPEELRAAFAGECSCPVDVAVAEEAVAWTAEAQTVRARYPGVSFAALLGAVCQERGEGPDLTPQSWKQAGAARRLDRWTRRLAGGLTLLLLLTFGGLQEYLRHRKAFLKTLQENVTLRQEAGKRAEKQIRTLQAIRRDYATRYAMVDVAAAIFLAAPADVRLKFLEITGGQEMILEGTAAATKQVGVFQRKLAGALFFHNVALDYVRRLSGVSGSAVGFRLRGRIRTRAEGNE